MDREVFLKRLNTHLAKRGIEGLGSRMLEDWGYEDLVDTPGQRGQGRGRGSNREWGCRQALQVLRIIRARGRGPKRIGLLRFDAWMRGHEFDFEIIQSGVEREFLRVWRMLRVKTQALSYDPRNVEPPKPGQIKSTGNAIGNVDNRLLRPTVVVSHADKLAMHAMSEFGIENQEALTTYAKKLSPISDAPISEYIAFVQMSLNGLTGDPDEIQSAAILAMKKSTAGDYGLARSILIRNREMNCLARWAMETAIRDGGELKQTFDQLLPQLKVAEKAQRQTQMALMAFVGTLNAINTDPKLAAEFLLKCETEIARGNRAFFNRSKHVPVE